jgi:TonB-dependent receptor
LSFCGLLVTGISVAFAQAEPAGEEADKKVAAFDAAESLPIVVVVGQRASLTSAQQIKKEKIEIVDSVISEDINKLPDINVTDALSRVTGVQIQRDRGEGGRAPGGLAPGVAIRGLTQVASTLNGREIFTAGVGRDLDFSDIPSEMLAGIDVYKTSSANQIEGGIGGTVDLRTRRPFDFAGRELSASVRTIYGDLVKKNEQQYSMLTTSRWRTENQGEVGVLLNAAYQKRAWREDQKSAGAPTARTDLIAGKTVIAPNGINESISLGQRERKAAGLMLEWAPKDNIKLYAEGNYAELLTTQDTYQIYGNAPTTFVAGSPVLFAGTNDLQSITWTGASLTTVGAARDTKDRTTQIAVGGTWTDDVLTLKSDLSYTKSHNNLFYSTINLTGTAATVTQDFSSGVPTSAIGVTNLNSLAGFTSAGMWYASRPFDGDLRAAKLDGEYLLSGGAITAVQGGVRIARRHATDAPGQVGSFPSGLAVNGASGLVVTNPYGDYIVGDPGAARDVAGSRAALGVTAAIADSNPLGTWDIAEETQAGYASAKFEALGEALDGSAGVRAVRTQETAAGSMGASVAALSPVNLNSSYNDYLPSANLRYRMAEGLFLRGAASKTITRQDFDKMSPSLTLNLSQLKGSAGNPELKPVRSDNFDLALEKYFNPTTSVYVTGFYKKVDGFVAAVIQSETYSGVTYQVSRPQNSKPANVRGAEVGYQQFYDFLPGWMSGLGLQANYTYVDSDTPDSTLGINVPLQNLSKRSYNIIGMYETGAVSARIAYNWRDTFLSGVGSYTGVGALPIYTKAYDWLDASVNYAISKEVTFTLEGTNLLRTVRSSYYGVETRPQSSWINDRQFIVGMTFKL